MGVVVRAAGLGTDETCKVDSARETIRGQSRWAKFHRHHFQINRLLENRCDSWHGGVRREIKGKGEGRARGWRR